jgi:hypothetical protein
MHEMEQAGSSGNASDLYSDGVRFESVQEHRASDRSYLLGCKAV